MNMTSALRPLTALAVTSLLLGTVVMTASARETPPGNVADTVVAGSCEWRPPDNPAMGPNWGPLFQRAV